jgi:hypothetical protein
MVEDWNASEWATGQPSPKFSLRIWLVKPTVSAHRNAVTLQTLPFHRESLILLLYSPEGSSSLESP